MAAKKIADDKNTGKIPTQGNLKDVIEAINQMPALTSVIGSVVKIISKNKILTDANTAKSLANYTSIVNSVIGKNGIVMTIATSVKNLQPHTKNLSSSIESVTGSLDKLTDKKFGRMGRRMKVFKANLDLLVEITDYIANKKFNTKAITTAKSNLEVISGLFTEINNMFTILTSMKVPKLLFIKFFFLKFAIMQITTMCIFISTLVAILPLIWMGLVVVKSLSILFSILKTLFDTISEIKCNPFTILKLLMINMTMPFMVPIMVSTIAAGALAIIANVFVLPLVTYFGQVRMLFTNIKKTPVNPLMVPKLMIMLYVLMMSNSIVAYGLVMGTVLEYLEYAFGATITPFAKVALIFMTINKIFSAIRATKVGLFLTFKLRMIYRALKQVTKIMFRMSFLFVPPGALIKIIMIALIFKAVKSMFINILICAPLAILAIPAMLILSLAFLALKGTLKIFCWAIKGMANPTLAANLAALILITGTLTVISLLFLVLALIAIKIVKSILWIIALLGVITLVVLMMVGIGYLFTMMAPAIAASIAGLILMTTVILLLLAMSTMLRLIQALNLDPEKIKESIRAIIDAAKTAITCIFEGNYTFKEGEKNTGFGAFLKNMGGTIGMYFKLILSIPFLANAFVAISLITLLARKLKKIQKFDLNRDKVISGIQTVMASAKAVSESFNNDLSTEKGDIKNAKRGKRLLKVIKRTTDTIANITKTLNDIQKIELNETLIKNAITAVFKTVLSIETMMEQFNSGTPIDPNSKPYRIISMKERREKKRAMRQSKKLLSKVDKVVNTINDITGALFSISKFELDDKCKNAITNNLAATFAFITELEGKIAAFMVKDQNSDEVLDSQKLSKKEWKQANKKLSKVESTIATIHGLTEALNGIKDLKFNTAAKDAINTNVSLALGSIESIAAIITKKSDSISIDEDDIENLTPLISFIRTLNDGFRDMAAVDSATLEKNMNHYINFVDKVNTMDVERVGKTVQLFEKMNQFSSSIKGDFDKLAEALSDKMLPVLEKLKDVMQEIPEKLDKGFADTSASIAATDAPATTENITAQVKRENPNATKQDIDRIVRNRVNEKAKSDARGIAAKLDEIASILNGSRGNKIPVTIR